MKHQYVVQGFFGKKWMDLSHSENANESNIELKKYKLNGSCSGCMAKYRIVKKVIVS